MNLSDTRKDFPIFAREENRGLIYFDNAATSQRPQQVLDSVANFYTSANANPLRGLYGLSVKATDLYEEARERVARHLNAESSEVIFTRNATESLNLVAYTWGMENIREGDQIVVTCMEHHSNLLP